MTVLTATTFCKARQAAQATPAALRKCSKQRGNGVHGAASVTLRTRPRNREGRFAGVHQLQRERHAPRAGHAEVEPLEVADVVVLAERVWTDLQLRARCAARVSAPKDCATELHATPQACEINI